MYVYGSRCTHTILWWRSCLSTSLAYVETTAQQLMKKEKKKNILLSWMQQQQQKMRCVTWMMASAAAAGFFPLLLILFFSLSLFFPGARFASVRRKWASGRARAQSWSWTWITMCMCTQRGRMRTFTNREEEIKFLACLSSMPTTTESRDTHTDGQKNSSWSKLSCLVDGYN